MITRDDILHALAQAYCHDRNAQKEMDVDLLVAAADEIMKVLPDVSAVAKQEIGGPRRVAILGRPNVGKSSLLNALCDDDRTIVSEIPGTTRDSIDIRLERGDHVYRLIDTAGLRRRARVVEKLERLSGADTDRAVRYAHVVMVVLDANDMLEKQDLTIARHVIDEGRALVIVANNKNVLSFPIINQ